MRGFLYFIWCLLPLFFFGMALWSKLESISNKHKRENTGDAMRSGLFSTLCVLLAVAIDQYLLEGLVQTYSPESIPLWFYQVLLLPAVLLVAAKIIGPTAEIRIVRKGPGGKGKRGR